jgi:hypothetical protein
MASPDKAKMVEIKTANRIKNLKSTGSSASAKASKAELEAKGGVYTSKDVTKGAKAVEARRKIDLGKTLARAKAKTRFKDEAPKAKPKTLNDFLKEGKRPPIKSKKMPSDADVIIKGYNDKKTLSKNKKK